MSFIEIRFLDILDIFLMAFLLYQVYMLIRGTIAINIFIGIFGVYLIWLVVKALGMQLLGSILGQVMGVGVIALLVLFQQETRRFLLLLGTRYFSNKNMFVDRLFSLFAKEPNFPKVKIYSLVKACVNMSRTKTGALIIISRKSGLNSYAETGDVLDANTSSRLIENIFFKNTPLHDGAMIIVGEKIHAARCILPVSENPNLPKNLGMRHRSALGISEVTDAFVVVVSEETGKISYAEFGELTYGISPTDLRHKMEEEFIKGLRNKKKAQRSEALIDRIDELARK